MMKLLNITLAALCGYQTAQASRLIDNYNQGTPIQEHPTPAEAAAYPEWAFVMQQWVDEYQWDPYTVTTQDGYELTMFKITKRGGDYDHPHRESILYQHGYGNDAMTQLFQLNTFFPGVKTNLFQAIDDGFDVWMGNFRGTKYSRGHVNTTPGYNESFDYWNFTYAQLGLFDVPAFVDKVYQENGNEKMYMVNTSLGTAVSTYALATSLEEDFFEPRVHKVIQLAPCSGVVDISYFTDGVEVGVELLLGLVQAGIYYIGGSDWSTKLELICATQSEDTCRALTAAGEGEAVSLMQNIHFVQNSDPDVQKFQEFIDPIEWLGGQRDAPAVALSEIDTIPIDFFAHRSDAACSYENMRDMMQEIEAPLKVNRFRTRGARGTTPEAHRFASGFNDNATFYRKLRKALTPRTGYGYF